MKNRIVSALFLALFSGKALSFWQQGHLMGNSFLILTFLVARIAYDILKKESPEALN